MLTAEQTARGMTTCNQCGDEAHASDWCRECGDVVCKHCKAKGHEECTCKKCARKMSRRRGRDVTDMDIARSNDRHSAVLWAA